MKIEFDTENRPTPELFAYFLGKMVKINTDESNDVDEYGQFTSVLQTIDGMLRLWHSIGGEDYITVRYSIAYEAVVSIETTN